MSEPAEPRFHWRDLVEVGLGACILAFPVAATEEVWSLGAELSLGRVLMFAIVSILLLATVIYVIHRHEGRPLSHKTFIQRVVGVPTPPLLRSVHCCFLASTDSICFKSRRSPSSGLSLLRFLRASLLHSSTVLPIDREFVEKRQQKPISARQLGSANGRLVRPEYESDHDDPRQCSNS